MSLRGLNTFLVAICVVLGTALAFTLYQLQSRRVTIVHEGPEIISNTVTQIAVRKVGAGDFAAELARNRSLTWIAIESTNYWEYMAKLQAIGCPDETVKDILLTDIAKVYAKRRAALLAETPYEYWRKDPESGRDPALRDQLTALEEERDAVVYDLLGVDFETELRSYSGRAFEQVQRLVDFLPADKQASVLEIHERHREAEEAIRAASGGLLLPEERERLSELQREKEEELAQLLTPEELFDYRLRTSPTADELRSKLAGFEPTEEEFRELFRLERIFDEQFERGFDPNDPVAQANKERAEALARQALEAELQRALGTERYEEYARVQDDDYRQLLKLGERLEFTKAQAQQIYKMKQDAQAQREAVLANPQLSENQRDLALAGMVVEVERSVSEAMGEEAYQAYRGAGGSWINDLIKLGDVPQAPESPPLPPLPPPIAVPVPVPVPVPVVPPPPR